MSLATGAVVGSSAEDTDRSRVWDPGHMHCKSSGVHEDKLVLASEPQNPLFSKKLRRRSDNAIISQHALSKVVVERLPKIVESIVSAQMSIVQKLIEQQTAQQKLIDKQSDIIIKLNTQLTQTAEVNLKMMEVNKSMMDAMLQMLLAARRHSMPSTMSLPLIPAEPNCRQELTTSSCPPPPSASTIRSSPFVTPPPAPSLPPELVCIHPIASTPHIAAVTTPPCPSTMACPCRNKILKASNPTSLPTTTSLPTLPIAPRPCSGPAISILPTSLPRQPQPTKSNEKLSAPTPAPTPIQQLQLPLRKAQSLSTSLFQRSSVKPSYVQCFVSLLSPPRSKLPTVLEHPAFSNVLPLANPLCHERYFYSLFPDHPG
jgi:hypothetical protein